MHVTPIVSFRSTKAKRLHPLVAKLVAIRKQQRCPIVTLSQRSGYSVHTIGNWENGRRIPGLLAFMDVLEVMGYELQIAPKRAVKPEEWISTTEAAGMVGVTRQAVLAQIAKGRLQTKRRGRFVMVKRHEVAQWRDGKLPKKNAPPTPSARSKP